MSGVFVLVLYDDANDSAELLGVFASKEAAVAAVDAAEEDRNVYDLVEPEFELADPETELNVGIVPAGGDAKREFCVLARGSHTGEFDPTDYYVLEF
jgi:hypothetical protein